MRTRSVGSWSGLCAAIAASAVLGQGPRSFAGPGASDPVAARLLLDHPDIRALDLKAATPGAAFTVRVPLDGVDHTLLLEPCSVRGEHFRILEGRPGRPADDLTEIPSPPPRTFRGRVEGLDGATAAASLGLDGTLTATVIGPEGESWWVQPLRDASPGADPALHVVYRGAEVLPGGHACGVGAGEVIADAGGAPGAAAPTLRGPSCLRVAEIAFDTDAEFYQANGSSSAATVADVEAVMNAVELIYARDAQIAWTVGTVVVRTDPATDPYAGTAAGTILDEFRGFWNANQTSVVRDTAHLMTGKDVDGNIIGLAYVGVMCSQTVGYGLSQSRYTANMANRVGLTAHELGHNWGANHCDGDPDCAIMCSGINGCAHNVTRFEDRGVASILAHKATRTCLGSEGAYPTPLPPRAVKDSGAVLAGLSVRIDALANDFDGNCQSLSLFSVTTPTPAGAAAGISAGTGPGGRDEVLYTAPPGFTGQDTVTYRVADPGNLQAVGAAAVSVLAVRTPEDPRPTLPGLDATSYDLIVRSAARVTQGQVSSTGTLPQINFPGIPQGNFATSGLATNVGAVFTATLTIPTAGTYTLYSQSDDGSLLYIDGLLLVNNDGTHGMIEVGATRTLAAGPHAFRLEYYQGNGGSGLIASIQGPGLSKQPIPSSMFAAGGGGGGGGVSVTYYQLPATPAVIPDFAAMTPIRTVTVADVNTPSGAGPFFGSGLGDNVGVRLDGYLRVAQPGLYTLYTESDDGSRLYVGPQLVVDNDGQHGMIERSGPIGLGAGTHAVRIDFFQGGGGGGLIARIEGPGLPKQAVPASLWRRRTCTADWNADGEVNGNDISDYINSWYTDIVSGTTGADTNADGETNGNDISDFINAWYAAIVNGGSC